MCPCYSGTHINYGQSLDCACLTKVWYALSHSVLGQVFVLQLVLLYNKF